MSLVLHDAGGSMTGPRGLSYVWVKWPVLTYTSKLPSARDRQILQRLIYLYRTTDVIISRHVSCQRRWSKKWAPMTSMNIWKKIEIDWRNQWICVVFVIVSRRTWTRNRQFVIFANLFYESLRRKLSPNKFCLFEDREMTFDTIVRSEVFE